jgi:LysM repeat protein
MQETLILLIAVLGITACGQKISTIAPTNSIVREILAYSTSTPDLVTPIPQSVTPVPVTPTPTKTPFRHTVEKGDTMLEIAIRYGIELEDLQAVNSGVDPNMLSVGSQLIIPLNDDVQNSVATPTPVPVMLRSPDCHPTADQGVWCFVVVENSFPYALEDVSAWVGLFSERGDLINEGIAFSPLNLVGSNETIPLMVFFTPPVPASITAKARMLTAVALSGNDNRYLESAVDISEVIIRPNGLSAVVNGKVNFPNGTRYPRVVWIAVVAYGDSGSVIGVRKWEVLFPQTHYEPLSTVSPDEINAATPVSISPLPFEIVVYSLGSAIDRIEVLSEARP